MSTNQSKKWYEPILDWFKLNGATYIADFLMKYGGTYIKSVIGGIPGTLAVLIFKWIIVPFIKRFKSQLKNDAEGKKEWEKFNEVLNKPDVTHDEVTNAEDDFFNRPPVKP